MSWLSYCEKKADIKYEKLDPLSYEGWIKNKLGRIRDPNSHVKYNEEFYLVFCFFFNYS